jgi:hypothetical protein
MSLSDRIAYRTYKITLVEPILGSLPSQRQVYQDLVAARAPEPDAEGVEDDPAELALAETLADLWNDIEEGRLGVKHFLTAYNRRAPMELRKRRAQQMGDWLLMLGFRVLAGEAFKGVHGRHCLLVDGKVECFVREHGVRFLREPDGKAAVRGCCGSSAWKRNLRSRKRLSAYRPCRRRRHRRPAMARGVLKW